MTMHISRFIINQYDDYERVIFRKNWRGSGTFLYAILGRLHSGSLLPFLVQLNRNFLFSLVCNKRFKGKTSQLRISYNFRILLSEKLIYGDHMRRHASFEIYIISQFSIGTGERPGTCFLLLHPNAIFFKIIVM